MKTSALDTPMMKQFLGIKSQYPDAILFYRMGDFYEMFLEDAELAAPILDIALTSRDKGKADAVPMCGIPVHSADGYVKQLAALGHRVAICEQVEDPKQIGGRRLVKREVVEVVTPGLVGDPAGLEARDEVSLVSLDLGEDDRAPGLAILDASTGDFRTTRVCGAGAGSVDRLPTLLIEELQRVAPREILVVEEEAEALQRRLRLLLPRCAVTAVPRTSYATENLPVVPDGFAALGDAPGGEGSQPAAAALIRYVAENQPFSLSHVPRLRSYELGDTVVLDAATRTHLELFENAEDRGRRGTLLALLDRCKTPLGARRLGRWIAYPLKRPAAIRARQEAVAWLAEQDRLRGVLRAALAEVRDLERILSKAARPGAVPRDLGVLRSSLLALPGVGEALHSGDDGLFDREAPAQPAPAGVVAPRSLPELARLLSDGLVDDPPVVARGSRGASETGYIRPGFRSELDLLHENAAKGREWIAGLEASERTRTGIGNLRVRYHPVHGYSLEVSKTQLSKIPEDYIRKQTLANVERYTTPELRDVESTVMGANERAAAIEREVLESLRLAVVDAADEIRAAADAVAQIDALTSLAEVARRESWVLPAVDEGELIEVRAGRHPVVEVALRSQGSGGYVPNDTCLDCGNAQIMLLTGPNMSGKSTYLRQVALIVLMAQIGSFVPAESARIGVVDRIFTRVGASDRLSRGESTFMVEMRETAEILRQASRRSLIILDEIGRGTSTFDGLSIAWAVAEHLHDTPGLEARTLFATHYHELIELANEKERLRNAHFEVREWRDEVIFLRRLVEGGANRSYGIAVAQLAGLPESVVARAREILAGLEDHAGEAQAPRHREPGAEESPAQAQLSLALGGQDAHREQERVLAELRGLDPHRITPLDALALVARWHEALGEDT